MNKATICSIFASAGVVVTSVLSVKCYQKIDKKDDIKIKAKKCAPAIVSGGATIGLIFIADGLNKKEIAVLTGSVAYFAQKFTDYEKEVREVIGDEKADEIQNTFYSKRVDKQVESVDVDINGSVFIDKYSGASIIAPYDDVVKGLKECENYYRKNGHLAWCDIFYLINKSYKLYNSYIGETLGWSKPMYESWGYDNMELKFELKMLDDNKYLIDYDLIPEFGFFEY